MTIAMFLGDREGREEHWKQLSTGAALRARASSRACLSEPSSPMDHEDRPAVQVKKKFLGRAKLELQDSQAICT
jgi:hypothetical protein